MQNLEVIAGGAKEKADCRPTRTHYEKAIEKALEEYVKQCGKMTFDEAANQFSESFRKLVYAGVKSVGKIESKDLDANENLVHATYEYIEYLFDTFGAMTPRQVTQLFPISKTYDGDRWGTKDYYYAMEEVRKIGLDNVIGRDKAPEFLMEYHNEDIKEFMIMFMMVISRMRVLQGGRDPLEEFLEENGVATYSYYENEGIMVNRQTGEVTKVEKPRTRVPKYMKVIEGGLN
ncbi:hypothetical protein D3Z38_18160 [Clostridiales bacterium]|nr:hypothetical protein [Clostridiales bacterium]